MSRPAFDSARRTPGATAEAGRESKETDRSRRPLLSFARSAARLVSVSVVLLLSCSPDHERLEVWGLGREGEVIAELIPEFERRNPGIRVAVQQMPWTAAHEKLLTAHVGEATPDLAQMGNTWIPEFVQIGAVEDLTPLVAASEVVRPGDYFPGIWQTNVVDGALYGIPWYVDTRVLFYRRDLLASVGASEPPKTWSEWKALCAKLREVMPEGRWPILLPTNEWPQPVILALQAGAPIIADGRRGAFEEPRFARAYDFYLDFFNRGYSPKISHHEIANVYQQGAEGWFAMYITGPWNIGEFRRRMPPEAYAQWATAPIPSIDPKVFPGASTAGGSSLVLFKDSKKKEAAWKLIEYLSAPEQQIRFAGLSGNLPARRSAWNSPVMHEDPRMEAFRVQLENAVPTPLVPEWEQIATMIFEIGEQTIRGRYTGTQARALMQDKADRILEKRRWVLEQKEADE
ncbi:MAG: sugar ABC transporter substrate-binding protein [Thermoanaerobaculia bacterium]